MALGVEDPLKEDRCRNVLKEWEGRIAADFPWESFIAADFRWRSFGSSL